MKIVWIFLYILFIVLIYINLAIKFVIIIIFNFCVWKIALIRVATN